MRTNKDLFKARLQAAGSTLIHNAPALQPFARRLLGLEESNDVLLRWRIAPSVQPNESWTTVASVSGKVGVMPATWQTGTLTTPDQYIPGMRHAVAYTLGRVTMVGTREIGDPNFLQYDPAQRLWAVAVRSGEEACGMAIGFQRSNDPDSFIAQRTHFALDPPPAPGIPRV